MNMVTIRGAITVNENSETEILNNTKELLEEIQSKNNIDKDNVVSIIFSCTKDLDAAYPARAARDLGYTQVGLMCFNEMYVVGSLEKCIRVMFFYNTATDKKDIKHIYLKEAKKLRPDLSDNT